MEDLTLTFAHIGIIFLIASVGMLIIAVNSYKRCPSDKIIVVYGKGSGNTLITKFITDGGVFVMPIIQDYGFLSLEPMTVNIDLRFGLIKGGGRVCISFSITFAISTEQELMQNAAIRLLGLSQRQIANQAFDIALGQARIALATSTIEEIKFSESFPRKLKTEINKELNKLGLNVSDIRIKNISEEKTKSV